MDDGKGQSPQVLPSHRLLLIGSNNIFPEAQVEMFTDQGYEHQFEQRTLDGLHLLSFQEFREQQVGGAQGQDFTRLFFEKLLYEDPGDPFMQVWALDALVYRIHAKEGVVGSKDGFGRCTMSLTLLSERNSIQRFSF